MEAQALAIVAAAFAAAGAIFRAVKKDVEGALVAAGLALLAIAAVVGNL